MKQPADWNCPPVVSFFVVFQEIRDGVAFEEIVDDLVQLFPHGQRVAALGTGAGCRALGCAGYRAQAALRQVQDGAYGAPSFV